MSSANKSGKKPKVRTSADERPSDPNVGAALRSVYQKAVDEAVPDEMLDLLSKLD